MTASMQAAIGIADRMASSALEHVEQPKNHVTPLRYAYGSKKRKAKRLASQAKGLYEVVATCERRTDNVLAPKYEREWFVLASGPSRALAIVNEWIRITNKDVEVYSKRKVKRICGITAGTKERIL